MIRWNISTTRYNQALLYNCMYVQNKQTDLLNDAKKNLFLPFQNKIIEMTTKK